MTWPETDIELKKNVRAVNLMSQALTTMTNIVLQVVITTAGEYFKAYRYYTLDQTKCHCQTNVLKFDFSYSFSFSF